MSAGGWSTPRLDRLRETMAGDVRRGEIPGRVWLVSRRGEVHVDAVGTLTAGGGAPIHHDTIFRIASLTKPVTAAATLILVEECKLRLDEPVDRLLPELAGRQVLRRLDGPLDDTVPARRPISVRDLLTLRLGFGYPMTAATHWPILVAARERGFLLGPPHPQSVVPPDEWLRRFAELPLLHQPGERWMYDLGLDVLGVLIARAAGQPFPDFLRERLFEPLGMKDTGFSVPEADLDRLPGCYEADAETGALAVYDPPGAASEWSRPPAFPSGAGGLVSTADDYHAFCRMLLNRGRHGRLRILSRPAVELMTADHLTAEQRTGMDVFFGDWSSWGFGLSVFTRRDELAMNVGTFGWTGGLGTSGYTDPREELIGILLTQRLMGSPVSPPVFRDFWTSAYQAIDD
ncbi:MAG TPA: serine hydrolase domain-containing protein [Thermoanaerobaculia bacterium]